MNTDGSKTYAREAWQVFVTTFVLYAAKFSIKANDHLFFDERQTDLVEHSLRTLVGQRVFALALGYEDLNDHDELRHDSVMGALLGKVSPRLRENWATLVGKSTLSRLECYPASGVHRYHEIRPDGEAIERLFVELFLEAYREPRAEIVLDLDATDVGLHGHQEARFLHG
jgi:hypothetical protein